MPTPADQNRVSAPPIRGVLFDFGGVISTSPFEAFSDYERHHGLAPGFIRSLNATDADRNAWARLERNEIGFDEFCERFADEARAAGGAVDARDLSELGALLGLDLVGDGGAAQDTGA